MIRFFSKGSLDCARDDIPGNEKLPSVKDGS